MSEYQYYEFAALDCPLTDQDMRELRAISSRAEITPTGLTNEYQWGNFKGDPRKLMEKYFDAFLYFANWGTRQCMFRLPADAVDLKSWRRFENDTLKIRAGKKNVIVEFIADDEAGEFDIDYDLSLAPLVSARTALLSGDIGPLYIAWLCDVAHGAVEPDELEPCGPSELTGISAGTRALAGLLDVSDKLLQAAFGKAAGRSGSKDSKLFAAWAMRLPADEKDRLLTRFLQEPPERVKAALARQYREATASATKGSIAAERRMADALLTLADLRTEVACEESEGKVTSSSRRGRRR